MYTHTHTHTHTHTYYTHHNMYTYHTYHTHTHTAPSQPPTQLYTSDLQPTSTQLHWTYSEVPPTGRLLGFKIRLYYQDTHYPERNSRFSHEEMYELPTSSPTGRVTDFSYILMYLSPGIGYNVYVSAQTITGEGPQARLTVTTLRMGKFLMWKYVTKDIKYNFCIANFLVQLIFCFHVRKNNRKVT